MGLINKKQFFELRSRLLFRLLLLALLCISCSTTKKLSENEQLYVGVKKITISIPKKIKLPPNQMSAITRPMSVAPNNPLISPKVRTPFPIGLWVYNWDIKKEKGFKWWLYRKLSKKPILLSDVQPELRIKMVENVVQDYGIFNAKCSYEVHCKKNTKKVKLSYQINLTKPLTYGSIKVVGWSKEMERIITQTVVQGSHLVVGENYNINALQETRNNIAAALRNKGYYFFQPDYMEYMADTVQKSGEVQLEIVLKKGVPKLALTQCKIGMVTVVLHDERLTAIKDTVMLNGIRLIYGKPELLKNFVIERAINMRPGQLFSAELQRQTQLNLIQLNMFNYANMQITVADSLKPDVLNVRIDTDFALPRALEIEFDVASKSNNLIGPGLTLSVSNRNIFKRAENFSVELSGSYEWQIGGKNDYKYNGLVNSYELGVNANLSVPRILGPKFIKERYYEIEKTHYQIGTDFLNRHSFFRMLSFWGSSTYEFSFNQYKSHSIVPFKLNYTYLLRTSEKFDSTINTNPAIAQSFKNQFIPAMSYTYTYERPVTYKQPNRFFWQTTLTQAGNVLSGVQWIMGKHGNNKRILGNIYSQFFKFTSEIIGYKTIDEKNMIATRVLGGVGYAYGNTQVMPYSEQFYIGGANSIRAFHIRSIGPGSYHPPKETSTSYLDQTGDIKLEANIEYRFQIYGKLHGATFVDAGNIWLLRKDSLRSGGELRIKSFWKEIALGTGLGLRYDLKFLILRLDLGVPIHAPYKTTKSGYYNIPNLWKGLVLNLAIGYPF